MPGRRSSWLALCTLLIAFSVPTQAQDAEPPADIRPWRLILEQQLKEEKTCDLTELLMFDEFKRDDKLVIEGRIRCVDGREFDFVRRNEHQKFEIKLCEPIVC